MTIPWFTGNASIRLRGPAAPCYKFLKSCCLTKYSNNGKINYFSTSWMCRLFYLPHKIIRHQQKFLTFNLMDFRLRMCKKKGANNWSPSDVHATLDGSTYLRWKTGRHLLNHQTSESFHPWQLYRKVWERKHWSIAHSKLTLALLKLVIEISARRNDQISLFCFTDSISAPVRSARRSRCGRWGGRPGWPVHLAREACPPRFWKETLHVLTIM